ncbi:hypothetical protein TNCV_4402431 [Trichonephila clavipes]|uniref:Uncharacterized protein n=1 Tax=Trichonephila clavipes TaxID=2585209 RepID=A0A8X6S358_TRICX|nr:hypothetical protein TNCV_4402431 [Trichonephila clavipes]
MAIPLGKEGKLSELETGWTSRCTPVVGRSLEHHTDETTIYLTFTSGKHHEGSRVSHLPSPSTNLTPHETTYGSTAI